MKQNNFLKRLLLTTFIFLLLTQSCNRLDLEPLDRVTTATFYKTKADFDGAVFASYSSIQDFWGSSSETLNERGEFWKITLVSTDDVTTDPVDPNRSDAATRDLDNLFIRASDIPYAALYTQIYEGILRANLVIENLNGQNSLTANEKKVFDAESKFLRAFFHFLALQMWGTPPLVLDVKKDLNSLAVGNSTKDALFAAIIKDLKDANAGLPASWDASNLGRATKWTARAFEGKVNVWKKDWDAAITAFEDVISNGPYSLFANYADAFAFDKENGQESIFEVQYGGPYSDDNLWVFDDTHSENFKASQGTGRTWYWKPYGNAGAPGGGLGWFVPTQNLVNEYEVGDPRLMNNVYKAGDIFYYTQGGSTKTVPYNPAWSHTGLNLKKYKGPINENPSNIAPNDQADFNNERYYRYAELLLLYAEALIAKGRNAEAMAVINNRIRARVGLGPTLIVDPTQALRHEKRVEMAFEPHRWFDITRWGIGAQIFGSAWNDKYNVFPFPQAEVDRSGGLLKQNTGY